MSINIDCVDCYRVDPDDLAIRMFQERLPHALRVSSIGHMVNLIEGRLGADGKMRRLRIFGHGVPGVQGLGNSYHLFTTNLSNQITLRTGGTEVEYARVLGRLTRRFERGGWVELQGCSVGGGAQGWNLLKALARLWQVNVAAGTVEQRPDAGFEVQYRVAEPGGRVQTRRGQPYQPAVGGAQSQEARMVLGFVLTLINPPAGIGFGLGDLARSLSD